MRQCMCVSIVLLAGLAWPCTLFGAETLACFNRGELGSCSERALEHVGFKSVVLQFVDPADTDLGEGLARLLWREILESISDLPDAGVILAYDRSGEIENALGEEDLGVFLQREYHDAARSIAAQQGAQMSIWGAVLPDGDELFVQTFLTLRQSADDPWTTLSLAMERPGEVHLSAVLGRDRINLPPVRGTRSDLFERRFYTRCALRSGCPAGVALRDRPSNEADIVAHLPSGSSVDVVDMRRQWLRVRAAGEGEGRELWINLYHVDMLAQHVEYVSRNNVNLRDGPGGDRLRSVDLNGQFHVLGAVRHGRWEEPWYKIEVDDGVQGWVDGRLVNRRSYMFSGVHLIAGLYRYGRGQYSKAAAEFEAFLATAPEDDNVTRAATLKFLAASRLAGESTGSTRLEAAVEDLDTAAELTPFDASVYTLRALVLAGKQRQLEPALGDLKHALELNRRDAGALRLLRSMSAASDQVGLHVFALGQDVEPLELELESLEQAYLRD